MAHPRIRDFFTYLTTLPASLMIVVCLFLPHTKRCNNGVQETPFEAGTWLVIAPLVLLGLLPILWRAVPSIRRGTPEIVLAFTLITMAMFVVLIPVAVYLMWGYSKKQFRGEVLAAMCSAALVMMWLFFYPFITMFDDWLDAARVTWAFAIVELVGCVLWTSAAIARGNVDEEPSLHRGTIPLVSL